MPNAGGYLQWEPDQLRLAPWLAGFDLQLWGAEEGGITWEPQRAGVYVARTHAHTDVVQRKLLDASRGRATVRYNFSAQVLGDEEDPYFTAMAATASGSIVDFVPWVYVTEVFDIVDGETYKLLRPVAWGVAPDANSTDFPAIFLLDGVRDDSAASITGQTLTAAATGVLTVRYPPAFRGLANLNKTRVTTANKLVYDFAFEEAVRVS